MNENRVVVTCSETLFPDLFVVDEAKAQTPSAGDEAAAAGITEADIDARDSGAREYAGVGLNACPSCNQALESQGGGQQPLLDLFTRQVDVNMGLFKHRIFDVLKLFHTPEEQRMARETILNLEAEMDQCPVVARFTNVTKQPSPADGQASSFTKEDSSNVNSSSLFAAAAHHLTGPQREALHSLQTVDSTFRFALEEISLRWAAKQDRPFNLKTYHEVAAVQIELREKAKHAQGCAEAKLKEQQKACDEVARRLAVHDETHAEQMRLYLQELQLLRSQIQDLQRRLKVQEDIPQLVGKSDGEGPTMYQVAHEKHLDFVNRRLTEECALLVHTLDQRNQVIKSLQVDLTQTKQVMAAVRDEFRKYIAEQEKVDLEFRAQYAQNEEAMNQAISKHAAEVQANKVLTQSNQRLTEQLNTLYKEKEVLSAALHDTQTEVANLKRQQAHSIEEIRHLRQQLDDAAASLASQKAEYEHRLGVAHRRIQELESGDLEAKLERAVQRIEELSAEVATLKETVASEKAEAAAAAEQHKKVVRDFERKIQQMEEAKEAAEKRRIEVLETERKRWKEQGDARVQAVQQEKAEQALAFQHQLDGAEKFQEDLIHEIMLFHRQINIVERFLASGALAKEQQRNLARQLLTRDIVFGGHQGNGSDGDGTPSPDTISDSTDRVPEEMLHTPRTLEYFRHHRLFDPMEMQQRITIASSAMESVVARPKQQQQQQPAHGSLSVSTLLAHLAKSTVTLDVLHGVRDRLESRLPTHEDTAQGDEVQPLNLLSQMTGGRGGDESGPPPTLGASLIASPEPAHGSSVASMSASSSTHPRVQLSLSQPWQSTVRSVMSSVSVNKSTGGVSSNGDNCTTSAADALRQQMIMEEFKSQVVMLKVREEALLDEIQKHQDDMFSGGGGGGARRPSSGDSSATAGLSRPQSGGGHGSSLMRRLSGSNAGGASMLRRAASKHAAMLGTLGTEDSVMTAFDDGDGAGGDPEASVVNVLDFPGLENAVEYLDMYESFEHMRIHLRQLAEICTLDAQRGALDPHDLDRAKELLHGKFMCFRAVESHANNILQRLHHKKDDIMRRREEELEKVLGAMQNLSRTHPAEAKALVKAARGARQHNEQQRSTKQPAAIDGSLLSAVIERPHSSMSVGSSSSQVIVQRKAFAAPQDVIVSGAAALMSLRVSQQRVGSAKPGSMNRSK